MASQDFVSLDTADDDFDEYEKYFTSSVTRRNAITPCDPVPLMSLQLKAPPTKQPKTLPFSQEPYIVDAHFHPDKIYSTHDLVPSPAMERAISCFAYPDTWPDQYQVFLPAQYDLYTLGYHPTRADVNHQVNLQRFESLLQNDQRIVGIGEVGLDYYRGPFDPQKQQFLLTQILALVVEYDKPLVLHVRDFPGKNKASTDALRIVSAHLPKTHPVYLHCFSYDAFEYIKWKQRFSNLIIGWSPLICKTDDPELLILAATVEEGQYVLETDSPYFNNNEYTHPKEVLEVAKKVGSLRKCPPFVVLSAAKQACLEFFRLSTPVPSIFSPSLTQPQ